MGARLLRIPLRAGACSRRVTELTLGFLTVVLGVLIILIAILLLFFIVIVVMVTFFIGGNVPNGNVSRQLLRIVDDGARPRVLNDEIATKVEADRRIATRWKTNHRDKVNRH